MPDMDTATLEALLAEVTPGEWRTSIGHEVRIEPAAIKVFRINRRAEYDARLIAMAPDLARKVIAQAAQIKLLLSAAEALGALPEGYCFCSNHRIGDDSKIHEPECADLRAAIRGAGND